MDEDCPIEAMEIDLEIGEVGRILEAHGVTPTWELVFALWCWMEVCREKGKVV